MWITGDHPGRGTGERIGSARGGPMRMPGGSQDDAGGPGESLAGRAVQYFREWRAAMAGSVNKVILVGNLGKDPEIRRTQDGRPIANLSVATSDTWRDKATGERKEKTEWHRVVIFTEGALQDRRAIPEEGRQGLHRGRAADPQMDRPGRRREILDRGGAAGLQFGADHARRPQRRRWRQFRLRRAGRRRFRLQRSVERAAPRRAAAAAGAPQQRHGRRYSVLRDNPF